MDSNCFERPNLIAYHSFQRASGIAALFNAVVILFLLFLLRTLLRSEWLAAAAWTLIAVSLITAFSPTLWVAPAPLAIVALYLFLLIRFGLVGAILAWYVLIIFDDFPMTLQTSAWYSGIGFAGLFLVLAIALYGFRVSLGSRPFAGAAGIED